MRSTAALTKSRIGYLAMFGGFLMLVDTVWGAVMAMPLDWALFGDAVLGLSLIIGLPAYVLDFMRRGRGLVFVPAVLIMRLLCEYFLRRPPTLGRPWTGTELLVLSGVLIQWSKLRRSRHAGAPVVNSRI